MLSKKRKQFPSQNNPAKGKTKPKLKRKYYLLSASAFLFILCWLLSQPRWMFSLATLLFPGTIYAIDLSNANNEKTNKKIVALTIDDGPSESTTDILATLNQYNIKATFFNISSHLPNHEQTVQQAILDGHEMGNHLTADTASIKLPSATFETNLLSAESALLALYPDSPNPNSRNPSPEQTTLTWLRPGMGRYNAQMVRTAERHGYQIVLGSRFPYDTHIPSPRFASAFILNTIQPGDIIVLHDGKNGRGDRTTQTLRTILPALQAKGYTITTLSNLAAKQQHQPKSDTDQVKN